MSNWCMERYVFVLINSMLPTNPNMVIRYRSATKGWE